MISGFLDVDKPAGWTSHDVVAKVRRLIGQKRVGHAGTLDPPATGLLVLGLGKATRLMRYLQATEKVYRARVVFGIGTDTLDATGAILAREPLPLDEQELAEAMARFVGTISQIPPMVSAVKVDGRRLYEFARRGETVERKARVVEIYELALEDFAPGPYPEATILLRCSSGTYVRSLAYDLGVALGGTAHVADLRRLAVASRTVEAAHTIEELEAAGEAVSNLIVPMAEGLGDLPVQTADAESARAVSHGTPFPRSVMPTAPPSGPFRVVDEQGELLAVYLADGGRLIPEVVVA